MVGLPESGKSTFLAAFWYAVTANPKAQYRAQLTHGDVSYLNRITGKWLACEPIGRTLPADETEIDINIRPASGADGFTLTIPEIGGERFKQVWDKETPWPFPIEGVDHFLFFLSPTVGNQMQPLGTGYEEMLQALGVSLPEKGQPFRWVPEMGPPQAQLLYILQRLEGECGSKDLSPDITFVVSAWDEIESTYNTPTAALMNLYPIIYGHLLASRTTNDIIAVSAQGGKYPVSMTHDHATRFRMVPHDSKTTLTMDAFIERLLA